MHRIATYWVATCIAVHMFAFWIEREECGDNDQDYLNPFMEEGMTSSSMSASEDLGSGSDSDACGQSTQGRSRFLSAAKKFRSTLKHRLFRAKGRRQVQRARRGMEWV